MTSSRDPKEVFQDALDLPSDERVAFVEQACGDDASLRQRVDALLAAHDRAGAFLDVAAGHGDARDAGVDLEQPGTRIGTYVLQAQLGEGGFGTVWLAEQTGPLRRQVALKVVKLGMDTRAVVARFEQERQALAMMDHPHIAKVFDGGATTRGRPYFAMELVRGLPITAFCDARRLDTAARLRLFVSVCHAVQHAHQKGVIHRDLKPSNVLVTEQDGTPVPKVIDFGIAKALLDPSIDTTPLTENRHVIGTPAYMAPEQAQLSAANIDTRADIYALGALLYELLAGSTPIDTGSPQTGLLEILRAIREDEPQTPSARVGRADGDAAAIARSTDVRRLTSRLRGDLDCIVMKALAKDRELRYVSADAFAADVTRHLRNEPVLASPPTTWYRLRKYARRHSAGVAASLIAATALLSGSSAAIWGMMVANEERDRARLAADDAVAQTAIATAANAAARDQAARATAALARAEAGEAAARKEATRANAVNDLLEAALISANPHENKGRDYKVRELLEDFERQLGLRLQAEPETDADVRGLLGRAYRGLGMLDKAAPFLEQALRLHRASRGDSDVKVALTLVDRASLEHDRGEFPAAMETLEEAKRIFLATYGPASLDLANLLATQCDLQRHLGRHDAAEQLAQDALTVAESCADNDVVMSTIRGNLAAVLLEQGRLQEAERLQLDLLASERKRFGNKNREVATSLHNLGVILADQGKATEAAAAHEEALALRLELFDEVHPDVASSLSSLGCVRYQQGQLDLAESLLRRALDIQQELGAETHATAAMIVNLATVVAGLGKLDEAEALHRRAVAAFIRLEGDNCPDTLTARANLAVVVQQQGRLEEAEQLLRPVLAATRTLFAEDHPDTLGRRYNLALILGRRGKHAEAEVEMRAVLDSMRAIEGDDGPHVAIVLAALGDLLDAQRRYAEAEEFARTALTARRANSGDHPHTAASLSSLAKILLNRGRPAEAEENLREALLMQRKLLAPDHPEIAASLRGLALALLRQDKIAEAEARYREALASRRDQPRADTADAEDAIADEWTAVLLKEGKLAEAERVQRTRLEAARQRLPATGVELATRLQALGAVQLRAHRHADAERTLRECLVIRQAQQPEEWSTCVTSSCLGAALAGQGKHEEADRLLLTGYERMQPPPQAAADKRDALLRLVAHYEAWGKVEEASKWRTELARASTTTPAGH
jgi:serine/threonine protein kinase/Tfp pilus assembly protein PilF